MPTQVQWRNGTSLSWIPMTWIASLSTWGLITFVCVTGGMQNRQGRQLRMKWTPEIFCPGPSWALWEQAAAVTDTRICPHSATYQQPQAHEHTHTNTNTGTCTHTATSQHDIDCLVLMLCIYLLRFSNAFLGNDCKINGSQQFATTSISHECQFCSGGRPSNIFVQHSESVAAEDAHLRRCFPHVFV